jgi:hypothetical protein
MAFLILLFMSCQRPLVSWIDDILIIRTRPEIPKGLHPFSEELLELLEISPVFFLSDSDFLHVLVELDLSQS